MGFCWFFLLAGLSKDILSTILFNDLNSNSTGLSRIPNKPTLFNRLILGDSISTSCDRCLLPGLGSATGSGAGSGDLLPESTVEPSPVTPVLSGNTMDESAFSERSIAGFLVLICSFFLTDRQW